MSVQAHRLEPQARTSRSPAGGGGGGDSRRVAWGGTQWSREQVAGALGEEGLEGLSCWSILLGRACGVGTRGLEGMESEGPGFDVLAVFSWA